MATGSIRPSTSAPRTASPRNEPERRVRPLSRNVLLRESERRLAAALASGLPDEEIIASRLLGNVALYCRWEIEHGAMLGRVALERRAGPRRQALMAACLKLIHRKALFEFLRDSRLRGAARVELVHRVLGKHDYVRLMVIEHGHYVRSAASFLCNRYLGAHVLGSALFGLPLAEYEELYAHYFQSCCKTLLLSPGDPLARYYVETQGSLKRQLALKRSILQRSASQDAQPEELRHDPRFVERRH